VLDQKVMYILLVIEKTMGMPHLKKKSTTNMIL
jgi:hypothetical protein